MVESKRRGATAADRLPEAPWPRVWAIGLVLALAAIGAWEGFWRLNGWVPTASDPAAWTMVRTRLDPERTALIGSSRMQADLDPDVWADATGERPPAMLALFGSTPVPTLEHLAATPDFRGTVVVDFLPGNMLNPNESEAAIRSMIDAYEMSRVSPGRWLETRLSYAVNPELVFRRPVLSLRSVLEIGWDRAWPRATFDWPSRGMRRNRFYPMRFPDLDRPAPAPRDVEGSEARVWTPAYDQMLERVDAATRAIQGRGGEVVFVRFPSCRGRLANEERVFPRAAFWDRFATRTSGRAVHFADHPSLAGFECPDGSHIDVRDTEAFTRALAAVIRGAPGDGGGSPGAADRGPG